MPLLRRMPEDKLRVLAALQDEAVLKETLASVQGLAADPEALKKVRAFFLFVVMKGGVGRGVISRGLLFFVLFLCIFVLVGPCFKPRAESAPKSIAANAK
jgi:hypothetical protein